MLSLVLTRNASGQYVFKLTKQETFSSAIRDKAGVIVDHAQSLRTTVIATINPCTLPERKNDRSNCGAITNMADAVARAKVIATELDLPWRVDFTIKDEAA